MTPRPPPPSSPILAIITKIGLTVFVVLHGEEEAGPGFAVVSAELAIGEPYGIRAGLLWSIPFLNSSKCLSEPGTSQANVKILRAKSHKIFNYQAECHRPVSHLTSPCQRSLLSAFWAERHLRQRSAHFENCFYPSSDAMMCRTLDWMSVPCVDCFVHQYDVSQPPPAFSFLPFVSRPEGSSAK